MKLSEDVPCTNGCYGGDHATGTQFPNCVRTRVERLEVSLKEAREEIEKLEAVVEAAKRVHETSIVPITIMATLKQALAKLDGIDISVAANE